METETKNESVEVVETQNNDTVETEAESTRTEKVVKTETPEAKVARLARELRRAQIKAGIAVEEAEAEAAKPAHKPFELGYDHKAYLNANGIKGKDEYELVKEYVANTGKDLEEVVESKHFQNELLELRQIKDSKLASNAASGNTRGGQSAKDTVDYWLNKGPDVLPPAYMTELRRQVVAARVKKSSNQSPFLNR